MKVRLRAIFISALVTISAFVSIAYVSCNRDKCKTLVCGNGGVCNLGECICPSGYEGIQCETVSRNKFLGNWNVFEKGSLTNAAQYPIAIKPAELVTDVIIKNFYNYFRTDVRGYVVGDSLFIPNQQFEGHLIFGGGYIYTTNTYGQFAAINMYYEVIDTMTQMVNDFGYNSVVDGSDPSLWNK